MRKIYVAGPMSGMPDYNRRTFQIAWNYLTMKGHLPVSPHFLEAPVEVDSRARLGPEVLYRHVLPLDIFALSTTEAVIALPGWEVSKGCGFEEHAASLMGIPWISPDDEYPTDHDDLIGYLDECLFIMNDTLGIPNGTSTSNR